MKKLITITALGVISAGTINAHAQGAPTLTVDVYQVMDNQGTPVNDRTVRLHQQNNQLCWLAQGLDGAAGNLPVYEHITSAGPTEFTDTSAYNARSPSGTHHYLNSTRLVSSEGSIQKCWRFDGTEPTGNYSIYIRIGDWGFPAQSFVVAP